MSLSTYIYRLKALAGDSAPIDRQGTYGTLTGGVISLVDKGAGDMAWRFAGEASTPMAITETSSVQGSGKTIAMRLAVSTYSSTSLYSRLAALVASGGTTGLWVGQAGSTTQIRGVNSDTSSTDNTTPAQTVNTAIRTVVLKQMINPAGTSTDKVAIWLDTTGRVGTTATAISTGQVYQSLSLANLLVGNANGGVVDISDLVVWNEELTDADCATLADAGIRATLDVATANVLADNSQQSIQTSDAIITAVSYTGPVPANSQVQNQTLGASVSVPTTTGTITIPAVKDWSTGNLRIGEINATVLVNDLVTGNLILKKTGLTTDITTGICTVTDTLIIPAITYRVTLILADGSEGTWRYTAV